MMINNLQQLRPLHEEDVKGIHDLYPASEIESIEVFEKLAATIPGEFRMLTGLEIDCFFSLEPEPCSSPDPARADSKGFFLMTFV